MNHSHVDLIIVSGELRGTEWTERGRELCLDWEPEKPLEMLLFTPEEFDRKKSQIGTVKTAVDEGVKIAPADY